MNRTRSWRVMRYRWAVVRRPMGRYAQKFAGDGTSAQERPCWNVIVVSWIGALLSLSALGWLAQATHAPLLMAPFGASVVLLYAHPDSTLTQPRNVIGGHLLGGVKGDAQCPPSCWSDRHRVHAVTCRMGLPWCPGVGWIRALGACRSGLQQHGHAPPLSTALVVDQLLDRGVKRLPTLGGHRSDHPPQEVYPNHPGQV
jgi:hypothetical protein